MKSSIHFFATRFLGASSAAALLLCAAAARAELVGPYTPDADTLFLFHLDEAAGGTATTNVGSKAGNSYAVNEAPASTTPPTVTDLLGATGYSSGSINFGRCAAFPTVGYELGYDNNRSGAYQGDTGSGNSADAFAMTNLNMGNGGQTPFTLEALVCPAYIASSTNQEIICTDSYAGSRGFQFRITTGGQLQFSAVTGGQGLSANIPTSGSLHSFVANNWYHAAVTYDGTNLVLYWTKLDSAFGAANQIGSGAAAIGTAFGAASGPLIIGNENRSVAAEMFGGKIDEVRISKVARAANQMQFFSPSVTISVQPVSQGIDYNQPVTFSVAASSLTPLGYQWRLGGTPIAHATNTSYSIAAVTPAHAGGYDCIVTNTSGNSATSQVATLTVGAPNFLAHRYSFTTDTSDSIGAAWGTNFGNATVTGDALALDGSTDTYMQLPGGLLNGLSAVTFEFWAAFGVNGNNARVFDLGNTNGVLLGVPGQPANYLFFSPHTGAAGQSLTLTPGDATFEQRATVANTLDERTAHVTCVVDPPNRFLAIYTNGVLEVANTNLTLSLASLNNLISYVGRSLYYDLNADAFLNASIDELRIYNGALSSGSALLNQALGASTLASDGPVAIVQNPANFICAAGQTAAFSAVADGRQPIAYQWYKNGSPITGATNATVSFTTVSGDNNATLQVWATNQVGSTVYTASSGTATLSVIVPTVLAWTGANSGDWDTTTANWNNGAATAFADYNGVLFDSRGVGQPTINLTLPVNLTSLSVNSSTAYLLTSSGLNGSLSGQATLLKQGGGKFTMDVTNNCVGANIIEGGTLQIGNGGTAGSLNSGPITNNAILSFNRTDAIGVAAAIHGTGTLSVDGSGGVVLSATNSYSGPTLINNGTINLRNSSGLGAASAGTTVAAGGQLFIDANVNVNGEALTLSGSGPGGAGALHKGGAGATSYDAPITLAADATIGVDGGATLNLTNAAGIVGANLNLTVAGAGNTLVGGPLSLGTGLLTKTGNGTLTLNSPNNYSGGTTLSGGVIAVNTNGALGTGTLFCDTAGRLVLATGLTFTNDVLATAVSPGVLTGFLMVGDNTNNAVTTISGPLVINVPAANGGHFVGPVTSGYLNVSSLVDVNGSGSTIIVRLGNVRFSGGGNYPEIQVRAGTTSLGANNGVATGALMDIGGNGSATVPTLFDLNGFNQTLAGLKNAVTPANVGWVTNSGATPAALALDLGEGFAQSFEGGIVGNVSLTLNSGTQTLATNGSAISGLFTYTGNTLVNGGTLAIGQGVALPNTPVISLAGVATLDASLGGLTLGAAQTLKGNGAVAGNVTVNGTLAPGASVGALTFSNNVTLGAGSTTSVELNKALGTNDHVVCLGTVNYGGTLVVTNLGGTLSTNDHFTVFTAGTSAGNFTAVAGSPGTGLAYSFTNGVLSVISGMADYPTNISYSVSGSTLTLAWPASHHGWILQSQTNSLDAGLSTNWHDVTGSGSGTQAVITISPGNPTVFHRLRHP